MRRVIQNIKRKIVGKRALEEVFRAELRQAKRGRTPPPRDGARKKIHSRHAPEVKGIGKGKARKP